MRDAALAGALFTGVVAGPPGSTAGAAPADGLEMAVMADTRDGGQAFPGVETPAGGIPGMTLRDYFAAAALARIGGMPAIPITQHAKLAYEVADAMLKEREKLDGR